MRNIDPSLIALLDQVRKTYEFIPERFRGQESIHVLTRVVALFVPGLAVADGEVGKNHDLHSWLLIKSETMHVIDVLPAYLYPGPVLVDISCKSPVFDTGWYIASQTETMRRDQELKERVAEIADAAEITRRFLGMP